MNEIIVIGKLDIENWHDIARRVYYPGGIAPTIHSQSNNLLQKILVVKDDKEDN